MRVVVAAALALALAACTGTPGTAGTDALAIQTSTGPLVSWDFGKVTVGSRSVGLVLAVVNDTTEVTGLIHVATQGSGADQFVLDATGTNCNDQLVLAPGASCSAIVRFAPTSSAGKAGTLMVDASPGGTAMLDLAGTGMAAPPAPILTIKPPGHDFGVIEFGAPAAQAFQVTNAGAAAVNISSLVLDQQLGTGLSLAGTTCAGALAPGASCDLSVTFDPSTFGQDSGDLRIVTDSGIVTQGTNWVMGYGAGRLTVVKSGTGTGSVVSDGGGNPNIDCGATCSGLFLNADGHTLTATADSTSVFSGWSVASCTAGDTCVVSVGTTPTTITAVFQ